MDIFTSDANFATLVIYDHGVALREPDDSSSMQLAIDQIADTLIDAETLNLRELNHMEPEPGFELEEGQLVTRPVGEVNFGDPFR